MQVLTHGSKIVRPSSQDPGGHGLSAQMDALPVQLLLLPVQRGIHDELLGHDVGDGFRGYKAAGDDILLSMEKYRKICIF